MVDVTGECLGDMVPPPTINNCCAILLAGEADFGGATRVFLSPGGEGGEFKRGRVKEGRGNTGEEFNPREYRIGACPVGLAPPLDAEREAVAAAATAAAAAADVAVLAAAAAAASDV